MTTHQTSQKTGTLENPVLKLFRCKTCEHLAPSFAFEQDDKGIICPKCDGRDYSEIPAPGEKQYHKRHHKK